MTRADGARQFSAAIDMQRWNRLDERGRPQPHPIDGALAAFYRLAMCGVQAPAAGSVDPCAMPPLLRRTRRFPRRGVDRCRTVP
ncbi:hypothetical protein [Nocardia sp. NPDC002869]|uniref:hypothetical protein n=1 Tax=Nocardia sp. NPDC002869 TaxID=3161032 RepID=UPI00398CA3ED